MTDKPIPQTVVTPPPKTRSGFSLHLFILFSAAASTSYFLWAHLQTVQQQWVQQNLQLTHQVQTLQTTLQQLQQAQPSAGLLDGLQQRQKYLGEQQLQIISQLNALRPQENADWIAAEVSHLLTIANQRIVLALDNEGALRALNLADDRLKRLNNPAYLPVRAKLAEEIQKVSAIAQVDLEGLAVRLQSAIKNYENYPLLQNLQRIAAATEHAPKIAPERGLWENLQEQLKQVIVIRYSSEASTGLLTTEQRYFVAETLRLHLETAHTALLRRHQKQFQESLLQAQVWLKRYYDQTNQEIKQLQHMLTAMQQENIAPQLPDISGSLQLMHSLTPALMELKVP
jgi:uroporphyrin-3 C-methyltransferase